MNLSEKKFLDILKTKDYKVIFKELDYYFEETLVHQHIPIINSVLFADDDIALEYIIAEHRNNFKKFLKYIQDKAINVYFSDKCLILLENLENREDLFI